MRARFSSLNKSKVSLLICFEGDKYSALYAAKVALKSLQSKGCVDVQRIVDMTGVKASGRIHDCQKHPLKF